MRYTYEVSITKTVRFTHVVAVVASSKAEAQRAAQAQIDQLETASARADVLNDWHSSKAERVYAGWITGGNS